MPRWLICRNARRRFFRPCNSVASANSGGAHRWPAFGTGTGEGVNFIYSSRVRFSSSAIIMAPRCPRHTRFIDHYHSPTPPIAIHTGVSRTPDTASIYLFIHLCTLVTRMPHHRLYDIYFRYICIHDPNDLSHSLSLSLSLCLSPVHSLTLVSNRFRCTSVPPCRL